MTATQNRQLFQPPTHGLDKAITLALSLAQAEDAILAFTSGQADAIVHPNGNAYLLRPAQEHLRRNERNLQAIIDGVADVITVVSRSGEILSQNQAVRRIFGYEPEELVGKSIFELVLRGDLDRVYSAFFNVIEGFKEASTVQFHHPKRDGSHLLVEATVGKMGEGASASVVLTMRRATHPQHGLAGPQLHETVSVHAARAKDRFLAMLSHELRTPLMAVLLGVEELQEDERFTEAKPVLAMIKRNVDLQLRLLDELLEFTTVGEHKVRLRMETIDIHEVIGFVVEICTSEMVAARIAVALDFSAFDTVVCADSVRLQQVLWNLVKNAIKFSPPDSVITITTVNGSSGGVTIGVTDQGIGIDPELLPLVFDAFQQGSLAEQRAKGGLGLGLFIAKGLTKAQGGTLSAMSEGRGKGSTFRLTFPNAPSDRALPPTETDSHFFDPARLGVPCTEIARS